MLSNIIGFLGDQVFLLSAFLLHNLLYIGVGAISFLFVYYVVDKLLINDAWIVSLGIAIVFGALSGMFYSSVNIGVIFSILGFCFLSMTILFVDEK